MSQNTGVNSIHSYAVVFHTVSLRLGVQPHSLSWFNLFPPSFILTLKASNPPKAFMVMLATTHSWPVCLPISKRNCYGTSTVRYVSFIGLLLPPPPSLVPNIKYDTKISRLTNWPKTLDLVFEVLLRHHHYGEDEQYGQLFILNSKTRTKLCGSASTQ